MGADIIRVTGLRLQGRHGVFEAERAAPQPFVIDAEVHLSVAQAGRTDDMRDSLSYADVATDLERAVTGESYHLIERVAAECAERVLRLDYRVSKVTITLHKPEAPMPQDFEDVSVTITRTRADLPITSVPAPAGPAAQTAAEHSPYGSISLAEAADEAATRHLRDPDLPAAFPVRSVLALGSNLGDSRLTLASAVASLEENEDIVVLSQSPLAQTKPMGGPGNQRDYLNQVVEIETRLSPHALLDLAQAIEAEHNRVREQRWGPRTLDVDIVTYAGAVIDSPRLQVPHPSAAERAFVLLPWSWMDPVALLEGRPVRELAAEAHDYDDVVQLRPGDAAAEQDAAGTEEDAQQS
ncbi:2-amino-4-hydroxy-6-hydroxymethyldihydropteridine diphosphokinase [Nesterenkonia populi]|uniref:2-amino-4-hydroxy-6- hydroxymethyldihydropteridine diphosphokinase n=1 Tax=Nesterenkonia populi TaxID=1591087 RepID=UPI0011BD5625|nr:2-amino-4-hydroxy-6-hydroxymethyldihydropteridine diphosphokinase [Nesterenkonia populi]